MEQIILVSLYSLIVFSLLTIFNAMYILGLHNAFQEPYILAPLDRWLLKHLVEKRTRFQLLNELKDGLYECIIGCLPCMASFHSIVFLVIILPCIGFTTEYIFAVSPILLIYIPVVSFLVDSFDIIRNWILEEILKNS